MVIRRIEWKSEEIKDIIIIRLEWINEEIKEIRRLDWKMKNKGNKKN